MVALYGGVDYTKHYIDNATRRDYQAGSTFKAIGLAAALENDAKTQSGQTVTPRTVYDGTSGRKVRGGKGTAYAPPNEGDKSYGQITLQQATDWSVNSAFAQLAQDTGLSKVRDTAIALGLPADTPGLDPVSSIPLGTSTPSVLDLAGVYATLANDGRQITPWLVQSVDHEGEALPLPAHKVTQAVSEQTAREVTSMLEGVVSDPGGTGWRAKALGRPAAGKTGTTDEHRSVWFVGYTPELVTSVALFGQDPATGAQVSLNGTGGLDGAAGGQYPAQIWTGYMKAALKGQPVTDFTAPANADDSSPRSGSTGTPTPSAPPSGGPEAPAVPSGPPSPAATPGGGSGTTGGSGSTPSTEPTGGPTTVPTPPGGTGGGSGTGGSGSGGATTAPSRPATPSRPAGRPGPRRRPPRRRRVRPPRRRPPRSPRAAPAAAAAGPVRTPARTLWRARARRSSDRRRSAAIGGGRPGRGGGGLDGCGGGPAVGPPPHRGFRQDQMME